jgi:biopolymer transport protein ExbD
MLVLVIILMVTAEFTKYKTVPIALPKVDAAAMKQEPKKISLTIKPSGELFWNDKQVKEMDTLPARLSAAQKAEPEVAVILRAEGKTEYSKLLEILDEVKIAGISKVGLAVDTKSKIRSKIR